MTNPTIDAALLDLRRNDTKGALALYRRGKVENGGVCPSEISATLLRLQDDDEALLAAMLADDDAAAGPPA
jgi:hypothetical protein